MIGILIPLLLLIPTPVRACSPPLDGSEFTCPDHDHIMVDPIYGPEEERKNSIVDWNAADMHKIFDALRDYHAAQNRTPVEDMLNKALLEYNDGSDDTAK